MHTVLAAIAENAVAAHSRATDGVWKLPGTLQEVQSHTTDHDLCLSCISPFFSIASFQVTRALYDAAKRIAGEDCEAP